MAAKESLRILIREGDALKKEVDAFALESQGVIEDMGLADRKQRLKKLQQRSKDLIKKATKAEQRVSKHTKGKEPTPINRFDEVKKDELKRLQNIKNRLEKLKDGLIPDETEEDYFRQIGGSGKETQGSGAKKVVSIVPAANSTLEDDEDEEVEEEQEGEKEGEGEENDEEMEDNPEEKNPSPKSGSKLKRLSLFRRSSKSGKDLAPKPKPADDAAPGETKREKKEREKQEKVLEKEKQEQAKREKREQEKREKLEREQREKERKKKEKEEKRETGKGKNGTANGTLKEISEHSEEEDDDDGAEEDDDDDVEDEDSEEEDEEDHKPTPSKSPPKRILKSPFGRKPKTSETGVSDATDEPKSSKEKKGGGGWKLFQRKPDRKMTKEKETLAKESASKKDEKKGTVQEEEDEEEDEDEEDEEDEDDEDASLEDEEEEDVSGEEEEVSGEEEEEVEDEEEEDEEEDGEDEEDEEDDEEDDDEEEDYEDDSQFADELGGTAGSNASGSVFVPPDEGMDRFEAVCDFDPEQSDDLKFKRGDIVTVLNTRDDGWWMAEDEEGNRGLVPSTYLKLKKDYTDFRDLQSPEYDGEGRVPGARRKSGVQLWKGLRKAMNETSVTDVLTAMGAIPSGFRPSMTAKLLEDDQYTLCNAIKPRLSQSNLTFKDIFWDPQENGIRAQAARVQKMMSVVMVKNMPQVGAGLETKNRHIRVAVFDGEKVLSNVHTIQATFVESEPKTWKFSPKPLPGVTRHCLPTPPQMAGMLPSSLDGDCFVRTNHTDENIGILFEVCLSYSRTKTGEKGEFCCGWVHLPLFDDTTGAPTVNKVYEVPLKGGTPYEQDVEVDPSISRKASTSKFRSMMTVDKSPRLVVKLVTPTKEQKAELDTLPDTIVSSACYISALSSYRKLLADVLLIDRINPQNTDLIHNPILASFPKATLYPDIMDALRSCWADKKRMMKKSVKKDTGQVKKLFSDACMESVYPLLHSTTLPPYKFGDTENEQERWGEISSLMKESQSRGILHHLLKPGVMHAPFNTREVTFNLLEVYREES